MTTNEKPIFPGFPYDIRGKYWPYPKIMDKYWHLLNGSEQKVLDFILRRTYGWSKIEDRISLSQFKTGIKKKNDTWAENGTGLSKNETIINATRKLEQLGFIYIIKQGRKIRIYRLRLLPQTEAITHQIGQIDSPKGENTIPTLSKLSKTIDNSDKRIKPYYNGDPLVYNRQKKKWFVINKYGEWLEYVGKESDVEWK